MSEARSSKAQDWMIFFISLIACIAFLIWLPQWFWVTLPSMFTYLVKALDAM